jgi:osmotically inducible lipoprotein OsmB
MKTAHILTLCSVLALAACGETKQDRAASGAGIGAATGAAVGAAVAGNPWGGAAVGGAIGAGAGAAVGALTTSDDIYFGRPAWR